MAGSKPCGNEQLAAMVEADRKRLERTQRLVEIGAASRQELEAALTTPAYPDLTLRGRVTYIDPRVDLQTRTAKVRVEAAG